MLFSKKNKIREQENQRLIQLINELKEKLHTYRELVKNSVDPSEEVLYQLKVTEAKYLFLLKEARARNKEMS